MNDILRCTPHAESGIAPALALVRRRTYLRRYTCVGPVEPDRDAGLLPLTIRAGRRDRLCDWRRPNRFTGEYSSETLDTTRQQVLRPRVEYGGSSNGAGLMTGIRFDMIRFSPTVGLSLEATVHGVGIRSSGEDAGYGFFNFFALGGRLRLRI